MPNILPVPPHEIGPIWPHIGGHFESFADRSRGEWTVGELVKEVARGNRQLWVAIDEGKIVATALTQVIDSPMHTVEITHCAGENREDWFEVALERIEEWGRQRGSRRMRIICRPGWVRGLKPLGFKETHRVLERDNAGNE